MSEIIERSETDKKASAGGLFIPAGIMLGLGFGFVFGNIPAGLFIGLGAGFVLAGLAALISRKD